MDCRTSQSVTAGGSCPTTAPSGTGTSYVYDGGGDLLAADSPASDAVYVFGEQITATASGGTTTGITGLRFISLPGGAQAVRTGAGAGYYFETSDLHGTSVITINNTLVGPVWRQFTPTAPPDRPRPGHGPTPTATSATPPTRPTASPRSAPASTTPPPAGS